MVEGEDSNELLQFSNSDSAKIEALFDVNRVLDAERQIREQLAFEPEDSYWLFMLSRAQIAQEQLIEAEDSLFSSLQSNPEYDWAYYLLSTVCHQLQKFVQELDYAKQAAKLDPEEPMFIKRLAEAHLQNGEIANARNTLAQLVKLEPDSIDTFSLLGDLEFELNNFPEAERAYRDALKFEPEDISLLNDLARSMMAQKGKLRESIDVFFNVIQLDPTNVLIAENLHVAIREWINNFYLDFKSRSNIFKSWGRFGWSIVWAIALIGATYLFSLLEK